MTFAEFARVAVRERPRAAAPTTASGGFVLLAGAARPLREIVANDAAGREVERADVSGAARPRPRRTARTSG